MKADEKECPDCAEIIKAKARKCRHCGYEFVPANIPANALAAATRLPALPVLVAPPRLESADLVDLLSHLVDKNLVVCEEDAQGVGRYRFTETVRQYGRDRLLESGEGEAVRSRHRDFFLRLAEEPEPHLRGPQRPGWLTRLETEHENLRGALESYRTAANHTEQQLRMAGALGEFWSGQSHWREGREWVERALLGESSQAVPARVRAKAHATIGTLAWEQAEYAAALPHLEQNLALRREIVDKPGIADALRRLGSVLREQGELAAAQAHFEQGLAISREVGDKEGVGWSLHALGTVAHYQGDFAAARPLYEAALVLRQEVGDPDVAWTFSCLASMAYNEGDYAAAGAHFGRSLELFREAGDRYGIVLTLEYCSLLAGAQRGQERRAALLSGAAQRLFETLGASLPLVDRADHDRKMEAARTGLGKESFAAAWSEGKAMSLEQAIEYALEDEPEP